MSLVDKIRKSKFCKYLAFTSCISLAAIQGCIKSEKLESKVTGPSISSMQQSSEDDVFSRLVIKNELKRFKEARLLRRLGKPYFRIGRIMQKHKKQGYALIDSEANLKAAADMILTGSPSAGIERIREILNMNKSSSENHASELAVKVAVVYHEIGEKAFNKGVSIYEDFQNLPYLSKDQAKEIIASHKLFNLILAANKCTEDIENDGGKNDLVVTSDKDLERYPPLISLELAVRKTYQEIEQQITGYEQQAKTIAKQGSYSNTQLVVILYNRVKDKKVAEAVRNKFLNVNFLTYVPVCDISIDVKQAASNLYPIIKRLQNFHKTPNICIIGHSIDGIIARTLAESPQYNDLRINKVILIATNNKGGYTEPISQLDPNFKNITIPQVLALNSNGLNPKISYFNIIGTQNTSRLRLVLTPLSRVNLNPSSKDRNDGIFDVTDAKASSVNNWNSDDLEKEYELNHFDLASDKRVIDEILLFIGINQNNLIGEYPSIEFLLNHSIEPNPSKGHYKISYPKGYRIISIRDYHCICSKTKVLQDIFLKVSDNITSHEPYHKMLNYFYFIRPNNNKPELYFMSLIDDKNNKRLFLIADNDYIKDNPNFGIQEVNSDWKPLDFFELYTNLFIAELNPRFTEYSYGCKIIIGDQYDKEKQTEIHFASGSSSSVFHMDDFNVRFNAAVLTGDIYKLMGRIKTPKGILHGNKRKEGIIRFYSQQIRNSGETFRFWRKSNDSYGVEVIKEKTIAYGTVECEYHEQMPSCIGAIYPLSWKNEWGNPRTPKLIKQLIQTLEDPTNTNPNFTTQKN